MKAIRINEKKLRQMIKEVMGKQEYKPKYLNVNPLLEELMDAVEAMLANAELGGDPGMDGTTDAYIVPIDDVEQVKDVFEEIAFRYGE